MYIRVDKKLVHRGLQINMTAMSPPLQWSAGPVLAHYRTVTCVVYTHAYTLINRPAARPT